MKRLIFTAIALGLAGVAAKADVRLPYENAAAVSQGETLYMEHCASCHGAELEGEPDWQIPKDNGMRAAPPHDDTGHTWHHPDAQLFDLTKNGLTAVMARRGMEYESEMIGFGDVLSDEEILAVLAFIKSTWPARVVEMHNKINQAQ